MIVRLMSAVVLTTFFISAFAQERFTGVKDLRTEWLSYEKGAYEPVEEIPFRGLRTVYFQLDPRTHAGEYLRIRSGRPYFLFVNGAVRGEFTGSSRFRIDSLLAAGNRAGWIAIHQRRINERDLVTEVLSQERERQSAGIEMVRRQHDSFRDFVVLAGLIIIVLFVVAFRLNPKLTSDYFSVRRIISLRDTEEGQSGIRLTGGLSIQFYVLCSLMIGYYLIIVIQHLPVHYMLSDRFHTRTFGMMWWQWLKLSVIVFLLLSAKVLIIFSLTRLFDMRGVARIHFFSWIRLLLVVVGAATVIMFMYFIGRGDNPTHYVIFLTVVVAVLALWIAIAFFKLSGNAGRSMFHLFSYLCATEIIPLLVTVKVLFQ